MTVADIMREDVITVEPSDSVREAARRMRDEMVGSVVVEEDGRPVGIMTDRDLTTRLIATGRDAEGARVRDVMTENLETITADAGVLELFDRLGDASVRRMPVVDYEGMLAGIVTHDDLNTLLADEQRELAQVIEAESPSH
jgi:CBS domain-containing protein